MKSKQYWFWVGSSIGILLAFFIFPLGFRGSIPLLSSVAHLLLVVPGSFLSMVSQILGYGGGVFNLPGGGILLILTTGLFYGLISLVLCFFIRRIRDRLRGE